MKFKLFSFLGLSLLAVFTTVNFANAQVKSKPRILVFKKTAGFHHGSIPLAAQAIMKMGQENGFLVDTTTDASKIAESNLKKYAALVFASTTGDILNQAQQADLERYMQAGGSFVGIHAAADAEYNWPWYGRMVGAWFAHHPAQQMATLTVVDKNFIATKMLPAEWKRKDEWYHYKNVSPDIHVLINLEESSLKYNKNGSDDAFKMGPNHPIAWYHTFENGRVFYTGLGHTDESYSEPLFLQHLLGGIKYAIGNNAPLNYAKAKTPRVPEENRFSKAQLVQGAFDEPTEMTILPNLDILVVQRKGEFMLYNHLTHKVTQVGKLNVYSHTLTEKGKGVNAEEGLLGVQADPDFKTNHFIYAYYSPLDTVVNRLSRFAFVNGKINLKSEKIILQVKTTREICCHTGGSIAFGKDHILFVSQGDNTTPFDEPNAGRGKNPPNSYSYSPLDDRPGFEQYDDRRGSGNTNDLRGKIMRLKIHPDGSYTIPEGNLFPKGTPKTRPEIYVMGNRNPYRISVDKKNGFLYWGEVGPDASNDSLATHGPRGYDEVNQARKAGNFGYPYFVGDNYPYRNYDYATGKVGEPFDPNHVVNTSRNNTGLTDLPNAQPAFIWYPYAVSPQFPELGSGGRTAMAGPVYHSEYYKAAGKLPSYYNDKLFIYDFIRNWIKVVTMDAAGNLVSIEPFMNSTKFNSMIDMEMGPDGKLYILEYGNSDGWFKKNKDSGIARVDYNAGNRAPEIADISVDKSYGVLPLKVTLKVKASDPENDRMTYTWNFGNGIKKVTAAPWVAYTYPKAGNFKASVTVKDSKLKSTTSKQVVIAAGSTDEPIDPSSKFAAGQTLVMSMDCKSCHKAHEHVIGPAFADVANKYKANRATYRQLTEKIKNGGNGVWGDVMMPAHPDLKPEEAKQILDWVFSLKKQ
ncbi:ThuA domain-containing protein [Mucilaginibacter panaciglaebae]|uniref:Glucose/arabinose dehydrogenase n=1 Tax=Mucilaginibacter panaciglaebae TaxID=502331 RepID=A0ABP7WF33_9SPHI